MLRTSANKDIQLGTDLYVSFSDFRLSKKKKSSPNTKHSFLLLQTALDRDKAVPKITRILT